MHTKTIESKNTPLESPITIQGARMHNLKNISVSIPRNQLVVVTGVSGSGKSSLTMDTLFAEGQRRYAESLSAYARQFLMRMDKPDVDFIKGICPAIAIEQKVTTGNPRSTVGSMTEIADYLRLLFAKVGKTFSPISGREVKKDEVADVTDMITNLPENEKVWIMYLFDSTTSRSIKEELELLLQKGLVRLYRQSKNNQNDQEAIRIEDIIEVEDTAIENLWANNDMFVLIDRLITTKDWEEETLHRISDSVQTAFYESQGECIVIHDGGRRIFNHRFEADGINFETPSPNLFSSNNPYGACPTCEGFGWVLGVDEELVIPDKRLSVYEDAIQAWKGEKMQEWKNAFIREEGKKGFPIHKPITQLSNSDMQILRKWIADFFKMVESNFYKIQYRVMHARYRGKTICHDCQGHRLRKEALYVKIENEHIATLVKMPIEKLKKWFKNLKFDMHEEKIAQRILSEIHQRLDILIDVGLNYLTLDRAANTLSGGESQRIQLTKFLGSNLTDSLYILDEPSIGLHPRDTAHLIKVLKKLRDLNNTVVVVEHDEMMMKEADHIIDMGPLAAHLGGEIVAEGNYQKILKNKKSLTGQYLSGNLKVQTHEYNAIRQIRPVVNTILLQGCSQHNLKEINVTFPLNMLCVVTGVSGSGKTTLVKRTLYPALMQYLGENSEKPGAYYSLSGDLDTITKVEMIDQNPIGKSSRSNPVTYVKAYDEIRQLFVKQRLSKMRGYQLKQFSFNVEGGRCETCKGDGMVVIEMQFLADVHLQCESCKGKRFKEEVLEITYRDKNIANILEMSVDEAILFFQEEKNIVDKLFPLTQVGLGYIKLGQSSNTLSGGEAQRVKLASFLGKSNTREKILFIFDEPTTGLHFHDINKLLRSFNALIEQGHSIIVIEHNTDVICNADWLIDIGPEGGEKGGYLLYSGRPEGIVHIPESYTGKYVRSL